MDWSGGCLEEIHPRVAHPVQPGQERSFCEVTAILTEPVLCPGRRRAWPREQGKWSQTSTLPDLLTFSFHVWLISNFHLQNLVQVLAILWTEVQKWPNHVICGR